MRVLFFAQLKSATGIPEMELPAETPMSADVFWSRLLEQQPALAPHRARVRLARNGVYLEDQACLEPNDEVALIPPVSGG